MKKENALWLLIVTMHLAGFIYQLSQKHLYTSDSTGYLLETQNIRAHFLFYCNDLKEPIDFRAFTMRPPVYPLFILLCKFFWNSDFAILLAQNLLSFLNFWLIFRFLKPFSFNSKIQTIVLGSFILFYPAQVIYANMVMSEILFQTFILLLFLNIYNFLKTKLNKHLYSAALWLCLGMLTKPVLFIFSLVFVSGIIFYAFRERNFKWLIPGCIPLAVVILYSFWNLERTGYFHFSSIKEINLLHYNSYFLLQSLHGEQYADSTVSAINAQAASLPDFKQQQQYINQAANTIIFDNLFAYAKFHMKGIFTFFLDPGRFDLYSFFGINRQDSVFLTHFSSSNFNGMIGFLKTQPLILLLLLGIIAFFNGIKSLAFFLFCLNRKILLEMRISIAVLVIYLALLTGPLGASRFAVPAFPLMLIIIAALLDFYMKRKAIKR